MTEGKSKAVTSCWYLEERFQECSKKGVVLATSVETLGVDLRTRAKQSGSEGEGQKQEVWCEILAYQEKSGLPEIFLRIGVRKLLRTGLVPATALGGDKPLASRVQKG